MMGSKGWISDAEDILYTIEGPEAMKQLQAAAECQASVEGDTVADNGWVKYIESRVKLGREWRCRLADHEALANASRYIRILGRTFRPVSISKLNPCGHLRDKDSDKEIKSCGGLADAIATARSATERKPGADKPEHRVQAFLIRAAMQNELRFGAELPGFSDTFDELIFITDELSLNHGKVRADIVALGCKDGRFFPVFIELKATRSLKRVLQQLRDAHDLLWKNEHARCAFLQFLSAVSGVPIDQIDQAPKDALKIVIWPKSRSGKEAPEVEDARREGFLFVDFAPPYTFSRSNSTMPATSKALATAYHRKAAK